MQLATKLGGPAAIGGGYPAYGGRVGVFGYGCTDWAAGPDGRRPGTGVWAGLWSLPEYEQASALEDLVQAWAGAGEWMPNIEHALTHFDWTLQPLAWTLPPRGKLPVGLPEGRWFTRAEALALGLPAPIRRLLES